MSSNEKPTAATVGFGVGDSCGRAACLSDRDSIMSPHGVKLADLRQQADDAKRAGDREAFWAARRAFLLAQAAAYQAGEVGR